MKLLVSTNSNSTASDTSRPQSKNKKWGATAMTSTHIFSRNKLNERWHGKKNNRKKFLVSNVQPSKRCAAVCRLHCGAVIRWHAENRLHSKLYTTGQPPNTDPYFYCRRTLRCRSIFEYIITKKKEIKCILIIFRSYIFTFKMFYEYIGYSL